MVYKFTPKQIEQINGMGYCSRYGALQGLVGPNLDKPLTLDSLVEQYEEQARYGLGVMGENEASWEILALQWAATDLEIIGDTLRGVPEKDHRAVLEDLLYAPAKEPEDVQDKTNES